MPDDPVVRPHIRLPPGVIVRIDDSRMAQVEHVETTSVSIDPDSLPTTWVRTGQTARHIYVRHEERYAQIVGITDRIEAREWVRNLGRAELGGRRSFSREEFLREWEPYYNENQTTLGSRFLRVETQQVYIVRQSSSDRIALRNAQQHDDEYVVYRNPPPGLWLYVGPPVPEYRQPTNFQPVSFTRPLTPPTGTTEPVKPRSRFDRDDII